MTKHLVILGAGYGGMFLATNLAGSAIKITLIDKNPYHELVQELPLMAAGFRKPEEIRIPISNLLSGTDIMFLQTTVNGIRLDEKKVATDFGDVEYDMLVIALGASTEYLDVPGAEKHTVPLRTINDAERIYDLTKQIIASGRQENIVIVGGGSTGVSVAGALSDLTFDLRDRVSIKVVESSDSLVPEWDPRVSEQVMEIFGKKKVDVLLNSSVAECLPGSIKLKDGKIINASMVIWTAGIKAYDIDIRPQVTKTENGQLLVDRFCQLEGWPAVYAIGDIAAARDADGKFYPATAQIATRQAKYLSERFEERTEDEFDYEIKAQVLSLGVDDHILQLDNRVVSGSLATLVEEFTHDAYRKALHGGSSDIHSRVYNRDLLSKALSGVTFAGFAFVKALSAAK